jgi:hypothetical protein
MCSSFVATSTRLAVQMVLEPRRLLHLAEGNKESEAV